MSLPSYDVEIDFGDEKMVNESFFLLKVSKGTALTGALIL